MKFQLKFIIVFLFVGFGNCGNLSNFENSHRLQYCTPKEFDINKGGDKGTIVGNTELQWMVRVKLRKSVDLYIQDTAGSFISKRHILTSAHAVITGTTEGHYFQWAVDGSVFDGTYLEESYGIAQVPDFVVSELIVVVTECTQGRRCSHRQLTASRAYLVRIDYPGQLKKRSYPMIVELTNDVKNGSFACITEKSPLKKGSRVESFGIEYSNWSSDNNLNRKTSVWKHRNHTIIAYVEPYIIVTKQAMDPSPLNSAKWKEEQKQLMWHGRGDFVGPLFTETGILIGVGSAKHSTKSRYFVFVDLIHHLRSVCYLTNICEGTSISYTRQKPLTPRSRSRSRSTSTSLSPSTELSVSTEYEQWEMNDDDHRDFYARVTFLNTAMSFTTSVCFLLINIHLF